MGLREIDWQSGGNFQTKMEGLRRLWCKFEGTREIKGEKKEVQLNEL